MKSKTATPAKKISPKKERNKIYLDDVVWYYEDDPSDKRMAIEGLEVLKKLDFSFLLERDKKSDELPE